MTNNFIFEKTDLDGLMIMHPFVSADSRGLFIKDYSQELFLSNKVYFPIQEVFYTKSKKGVIRALHFQENVAQAKLVRCIMGEVYDVVVDLRPSSPTFAEWRAFILSESNKIQLLIPEGFAHGYLVIEDAIVSYKCNEKFYPEFDSGIIWNDRDLNIDWPLHLVDKLIISERDRGLKTFREYKHILIDRKF